MQKQPNTMNTNTKNRFSLLMQADDDGELHKKPAVAKQPKKKFTRKNSMTWSDFLDTMGDTGRSNCIRSINRPNKAMGLRERARLARERKSLRKFNLKDLKSSERKPLLVKREQVFSFTPKDFPMLKHFVASKDATNTVWHRSPLNSVIKSEDWQILPDPLAVLEAERLERAIQLHEEKKLLDSIAEMTKTMTMSDEDYTYMINMTDTWHMKYAPILNEIEKQSIDTMNKMLSTKPTLIKDDHINHEEDKWQDSSEEDDQWEDAFEENDEVDDDNSAAEDEWQLVDNTKYNKQHKTEATTDWSKVAGFDDEHDDWFN